MEGRQIFCRWVELLLDCWALHAVVDEWMRRLIVVLTACDSTNKRFPRAGVYIAAICYHWYQTYSFPSISFSVSHPLGGDDCVIFEIVRVCGDEVEAGVIDCEKIPLPLCG